jgi:hypothetical protein
MLKTEADRLSSWLMKAAAGIRYGTVSVVVTVHDGQVRMIERNTSEKEKTDEGRTP